MQHGQPLSYKTKHTPTTWSSSYTPWIYPKELRTYICTKPCPQMFVAAVLISAAAVSFSRCADTLPSVQPMEYYSVLKRNDLSGHAKTRRNLKCLSMWKATYCMVPNIRRTSWKRQNHGDSENIRVDRAQSAFKAAKCSGGILTVVTGRHAFVQAPGVHAARRSPPTSCALLVTR